MLSVEVGVSSTTIGYWLSILEASHIIFKLQPWYASRSSQVVKTPKVYFCDTGLLASLLGIETPSQMLRDPLLGNVFENMVVLEALKNLLIQQLPKIFIFSEIATDWRLTFWKSKENRCLCLKLKAEKLLIKNFSEASRILECTILTHREMMFLVL